MGRLLIWLSGARRQVLDECPTDRAKYVGIGTAILITAAMAAVSLAFALVTALKATLWVALPFALAWGVAILCLDRLFVVSLPREGRWWVQLLRAVPRFLLALLLGFVISTPFVLQIFRPEIQHQITVLHTQAENAYLKAASTGHLQQEIDQDTTRVSNLTTQAGGGGSVAPPPQSAQLAGLRTRLRQDQAQRNSAYNKWQCQLYGKAPNGKVCRPPGDGQLAKADHNLYLSTQALARQLNHQISSEQRQVNHEIADTQRHSQVEATGLLPRARQNLKAAQDEQAAETSSFTSQNNNNGGLLIRLQALGDVTAHSTTLSAARWLLFALFVAIDCMPVMIKVMLNLGPENNYDKMLKAEEKKQLRVAASNRALRQAAERMAGETVIGEAQSRLAGWNAAIPGVTQSIIAARERVESKKLSAWENAQSRRLVNGHGTMPGDTVPDPRPPVGFIDWPAPAGAAAPTRWWPPAPLLNLVPRVRQFLGASLLWRRRPGSHWPGSRRAGPRPYGAPFSPNGLGRPSHARRGASP